MSVRAVLRHARSSAQKLRLVADMVRGMQVTRALNELEFSTKKGAAMLKKLLKSAVANAENNEGMDVDSLVLNTVYVDEAPSFGRFRARAKGRGNSITKRNCHITVIVGPKQQTKRERK